MNPARTIAALSVAASLLASCEVENGRTEIGSARGAPEGGIERRVEDPAVPDRTRGAEAEAVVATPAPTAEPSTTAPVVQTNPTTVLPNTVPPTTVPPTAVPPTAVPPTTVPPTVPPTTVLPNTVPPPVPEALPSTAVVDGRRVASLWPFTSSSPWNTPLGSAATYADESDARVQRLRSANPRGWPAAINIDHYTHQVYRTTQADPLESIWVRASSVAPHHDFTAQYHIPASAIPSAGTDGHMHIVQPDGRTLDENWIMSGGPGGWTSEYWVRTDLYTDGFQGGTRAYGGSAIGGLVRDWELAQGRIDHVIAIALRPDQLRNGPVWPATREDGGGTNTGNYTGGSVGTPMGSLLAIAPDVDVTALGLSPSGVAIATALQNYGGYVVDLAGSTIVAAAEPSTPSQYRPWGSDAGIIQSVLTIVENNGPGSPGGPGARIAATPPPLQ